MEQDPIDEIPLEPVPSQEETPAAGDTEKTTIDVPPSDQQNKSTWWLWLLFVLLGIGVISALMWPSVEKSMADNIEIVVLPNTLRLDRRANTDPNAGMFDRFTGDMVVTLDAQVTNHNFIAIGIKSLTYEITLNDQPIGDGKALLPDEEIDIGTNESVTIPMELRFPIASTGMAKLGSFLNQKLGIGVTGKVVATAPMMTLERQFEIEGLTPVVKFTKP